MLNKTKKKKICFNKTHICNSNVLSRMNIIWYGDEKLIAKKLNTITSKMSFTIYRSLFTVY